MTGKQKKQFEEAFLSAFGSYYELERLFSFELDIDLNTLSSSSKTMLEIILDVIKWTEKHDKIKEVVDAALTQVPGNVKLRGFLNSIDTIRTEEPEILSKGYIEQWIMEGKIEQAIIELIKYSKKNGHGDLNNDLIPISARYHSNEKDNMLGIISHDDYTRERAKIIHSLQYYLEKYKPSI